jgi:hypothetical protein
VAHAVPFNQVKQFLRKVFGVISGTLEGLSYQ